MSDKKKKKPTKNLSAKKTVKPAAKKTASKPKGSTKPKTPAVKRAPKVKSEKKPAVLKTLKHNEKYELGTDESLPIIIKRSGAQKPKRAKKELRRVARTGGYTVWDARAGKTFATQKEASDYAADVFKRTGEVVAVTKTERQVSHTFKSEPTDK